MKKNRLIRSYAGIPKTAWTDNDMETTLTLVELPVIEDDPGENNEPEEKNILTQCSCCKRSVEIILDGDGNIMGVKCPDCDMHDIKAS